MWQVMIVVPRPAEDHYVLELPFSRSQFPSALAVYSLKWCAKIVARNANGDTVSLFVEGEVHIVVPLQPHLFPVPNPVPHSHPYPHLGSEFAQAA